MPKGCCAKKVASEVTTLWHYINKFIIIIIVIFGERKIRLESCG